jgi:hypothetical protein
MASSDAFSELSNFALEGDFPEDVELIQTQQLFFSNALNVPMMNDSGNKDNLEVNNVVKSDLNLPEGKSKNDTMVIIILDGINDVVIEKKWQEKLYFSVNYGL